MQDQNQQNPSEQEPRGRQLEGLLWLILAGLCIAVIGIVIYRYREPIRASFMKGQIENFDQVIVKDNYHDVSLENGQSWDISYETTDHRYQIFGIKRRFRKPDPGADKRHQSPLHLVCPHPGHPLWRNPPAAHSACQ